MVQKERLRSTGFVADERVQSEILNRSLEGTWLYVYPIPISGESSINTWYGSIALPDEVGWVFLLMMCLRRTGHIHAGLFLSMISHDIFESGLLDTTMWTLTREGDITTKVDEMPGKDVGNGDLHSLRVRYAHHLNERRYCEIHRDTICLTSHHRWWEGGIRWTRLN